MASDETDHYVVEIQRGADLARRLSAVDGLICIGPQATKALPALLEALRDSHPIIRRAAADALGWIGPEAVVALPAIGVALGDDDAGVRADAAWALGRIGKGNAAVLRQLVGVLRDDDPSVRAEAAWASGYFGPESLAALSEAIEDDDVAVRVAAVDALGQIGPLAVPALLIAMRQGDDDVRDAVEDVLEKLGPSAAQALADVLGGDDPKLVIPRNQGPVRRRGTKRRPSESVKVLLLLTDICLAWKGEVVSAEKLRVALQATGVRRSRRAVSNYMEDLGEMFGMPLFQSPEYGQSSRFCPGAKKKLREAYLRLRELAEAQKNMSSE